MWLKGEENAVITKQEAPEVLRFARMRDSRVWFYHKRTAATMVMRFSEGGGPVCGDPNPTVQRWPREQWLHTICNTLALLLGRF